MRTFLSSFAILTILISFSCSNSSDQPCDYIISDYEALVTRVDFKEMNDNGDSTFTVWVSFSSGSLNTEDQDWGAIRGIEFTRESIVRNQAFIGNSYTGTISDRTSGTCETPRLSFNQPVK